MDRKGAAATAEMVAMSDESMTEMSGDGVTESMARIKCTLRTLLVRNLLYALLCVIVKLLLYLSDNSLQKQERDRVST